MNSKFFVDFKNEAESLTLEFSTLDTSISEKWFDKLKIALSHLDPIKENERMYNFPTHNWSEERIINELNRCITTINEYKQFINLTAIVGGDQNHHNELHKYFELIRGYYSQPTEYFDNAPRKIQLAIELYNNMIHRLEDHLRYKNLTRNNSARIVITFNDDLRDPLADEDFDQFVTKFNFGTVHVNYCEVGKTLLNVFHDKDEIVGDGSILPHRYYAAGMTLKFYNGTAGLYDFDNWWNKNESKLNSLGFYKGDKTLALGYLPVAKLIYNTNETDIINNISKFTKVNSVYIANK
jgi:hypothetical protein